MMSSSRVPKPTTDGPENGWYRVLEAAGLSLCLPYRDFDLGVPIIENIQRAIDNSRHTLLLLTPAWIASEWNAYEAVLSQTVDPAARQRKLLPILLVSCEPPTRMAHLSYADFTDTNHREEQLGRVIAAIQGELRRNDLGPRLSILNAQSIASFMVPFMRNPDFVGR